MNIVSYTGYFHDGSILEIQYVAQDMIISMKSAEMCKEDLLDDATLSENNRMKGKLHIEGIKSIKENDKNFSGIFGMKYENAEISNFDLINGNLKLNIIWGSFSPYFNTKNFSILQIEAEKIWWENLPDLKI